MNVDFFIILVIELQTVDGSYDPRNLYFRDHEELFSGLEKVFSNIFSKSAVAKMYPLLPLIFFLFFFQLSQRPNTEPGFEFCFVKDFIQFFQIFH